MDNWPEKKEDAAVVKNSHRLSEIDKSIIMLYKKQEEYNQSFLHTLSQINKEMKKKDQDLIDQVKAEIDKDLNAFLIKFDSRLRYLEKTNKSFAKIFGDYNEQ